MNHAGEITPLVALARPHVALVTTIAPVHIEHLGSLGGDRRRQGRDLLRPRAAAASPCSTATRRSSSGSPAPRARVGARVASFGAGAGCDARLIEVVALDGGSRVSARVRGRELDFGLGAPGRHMAENALGVLLACEALGADLADCGGGARRISRRQKGAARASR